MRTKTRKTAAKIAASVVLVGGAASVAGLGTYGSFTSSTSASAEVSNGTIELSSAQGAQGTSIAAVGIVPGDSVQRSVVLARGAADEAFGSVTLTTTGSAANLMTSDAVNGLQVAIDQCSKAWTVKAGTKELECVGGTVTSVLATRPVIGANLALPAATTALNGTARQSNLRVTMTLPTTAGNDFQGMKNTVTFGFLATQRGAQSR